MSINLTMDFSVDKENKTIKIKREFAADIKSVWDAFTKSEILDKWWAPKPWKAETKRMDFREGGQWLYAMKGPEGEVHWSIADYIKIQPQKQFTGLDGFTDSEGKLNESMPQSKWEVNFSEKGNHTQVDFHIIYPDLAQLEETIKMGFKEGIGMAMDNLDEIFAKK